MYRVQPLKILLYRLQTITRLEPATFWSKGENLTQFTKSARRSNNIAYLCEYFLFEKKKLLEEFVWNMLLR